MTINITHLPIPHKLYQRAERLAAARDQDIITLFDELLARVESKEEANEYQMAQEEIAYQRLLPMLRQQYLGQYIALYHGQLVDHDRDELILLTRIEQQFPNETVLIKPVSAQPEPILVSRSPRVMAEE